MNGQGSRVHGGWRQGQEMEQDVVDSAITHRMLTNASLTKSWYMVNGLKCRRGKEGSLRTKPRYQ